MNSAKIQNWSRREFLRMAVLAGMGAPLGLQSNSLAAEPPPETTRIRLGLVPSVCLAPQYVAEPLLRAEGFTDIQYLSAGGGGGVPSGGGGICANATAIENTSIDNPKAYFLMILFAVMLLG